MHKNSEYCIWSGKRVCLGLFANLAVAVCYTGVSATNFVPLKFLLL